ncbi:MAG: hypothetical protein LBR53_05975 [Deltaproteobacteria bacterium]|jgi:flagellin-like hook-associated protein FlgL|nr:hypothetical protein [Deltaproteobacteria bacterium]
MALIVNHNMAAQNAARNLSTIYDRLSTSVQRLSSGLRINSAADDAAGLAIREMMRADIATMNQGIRNTADAISMIQTADGALSIIDEKLTRMKELAEQAATGTYTTAQREIINSEYQAMAAEIDRIANATNFNGLKLLDGSVTNQHGGQGIKIHFGVSNKDSEDYYFVNIGDARATSSTGLRIGGDAKNDIWGQGAAGSGPLSGPGCCTAGYTSLDGNAGFISGQTFSYGYNWDWMEDDDPDLLAGKYLAGRYTVSSSESLQDLINKVNAGTQSRVGVQIHASALQAAVVCGGTVAVCVGDEAYYWGIPDDAQGGIVHTPEFLYKATMDNLFKGTGNLAGLYTSDTVLKNLLNAQSVQLSATVFGEEDLSAGLAAVKDAMRNLLGSTVLTLSANDFTNATDQQALLSALGVTNTNPPGKSANFGTGIYHANGVWTMSASLGKSLGMTELTFELSAAFATTNAYITKASAVSALSGIAGVTSAFSTGGQTQFDMWVSGNIWTVNAASAQAINARRVSIDIKGAETSAVDARDWVNKHYVETVPLLTGQAGKYFESGVTDGVMSSYIYVDAATGRWTREKAIGDSLGWDQVDFTVTSTTKHTLAHDAYGYISAHSAAIKTALAAFKATQVAASQTSGDFTLQGLWYSATTGEWTTSATLADRLSGTTNVFNQITYKISALCGKTAQQLYDIFKASYQLYAAQFTKEVYAKGMSTTSAVAALRSAITNAVGTTNPTPGTMVSELGDTWSDMFAKIRAIEPDLNRRLGQTGLRDITALTQSGGELYDAITAAGLTDQIEVGALTQAQLDTLGAALTKDDVSSKEGPGKDERFGGAIDVSKHVTQVGSAGSKSSSFTFRALASAINNNPDSQFWAMVQKYNSNGVSAEMVYIFTKDGGDFNNLLACDVAADNEKSREGLASILFENTSTGKTNQSGTTFTLGGEHWGTMKPTQTKASLGNEVWNVTLNGRDVGYQRDLWISNNGDLETPGLDYGTINGMNRESFVEIQNAANGDWKGAEVRTQSSAQEALDAITESINVKDKIRADLGAMQNRLENTMSNLTIQAENLQASESRISDVDVATEMTEFTRNNVLSQAATSMLAQANSLSQLALSLIR